MKYDPLQTDVYEQHESLMRIVAKQRTFLSATLHDDSVDMSSEKTGKRLWTPDGLRFSIERWNVNEQAWVHYRESDVLITPVEIEAIVRGEKVEFLQFNTHITHQQLVADIRRFEVAFKQFDVPAREALYHYIEHSNDGIAWAQAMQFMVSLWMHERRERKV